MTVWLGRLPSSPLGPMWAALAATGLVAVSLWDDRARFAGEVHRLTDSIGRLDPDQTAPALDQLLAYLEGRRREFDLAIDWSVMSPFQAQVLSAVAAVPYGHTRTYVDIAHQLGRPGAARAVGRANATNPMPLVIPCHRIVGSQGRLRGYGAPGGVATKAWLLRLEGNRLL